MRLVTAIAMLLACSYPAEAGADPPQPMKLRVGQSRDYTPGFLPAQVICDDLAVVGVEDIGTMFRLTGKTRGTTLCGFWNLNRKGTRVLLEITVVP